MRTCGGWLIRLANWWTEQTSGTTDVGGTIQFRFIPGGFDMQVSQLDPDRLVRWDVVEGPVEWIGTSVQFDLKQNDGYTIVLFKHEGWTDVG